MASGGANTTPNAAVANATHHDGTELSCESERKQTHTARKIQTRNAKKNIQITVDYAVAHVASMPSSSSSLPPAAPGVAATAIATASHAGASSSSSLSSSSLTTLSSTMSLSPSSTQTRRTAAAQ